MNTRDIEEEKMQKKRKKRTKKILTQLKEQIEFYFGDANLSKDRFMKQEITKHPEGYVLISIIASFNRIKQTTDDVKLVVKAMKMSSLLEVSEDETMVRRKTPIPEPRNTDAETVYVERLPPYADHEWLKGIFSKYGKVVYVSIPRFKHNGDIKGFAFVEFENADNAQEAVQVFNKGGKYRQDNEPEVKTENGDSTDQVNEQPKITKAKRKRSHSESELDTQRHKESKRRRTISESSADSDKEGHRDSKGLKKKGISELIENCQGAVVRDADSKDRKERKSVQWGKGVEGTLLDRGHTSVLPTVGQEGGHDEPMSNEDKIEQKQQGMSGKESAEESFEDEARNESKKQKKRKRKKKEKKETRLPHLRVISKFEWQRLKKEYKDMQREAMKKLKEQLSQSKPSADDTQHENQQATQAKDLDNEALEIKNGSKIPKESKEQVSEVKKLPYTPGVVLKFLCQNGETNKAELRALFSSYSPVAYLDFTEGGSEGHVRFHTGESCDSVLKAMLSKSDKVKVEKVTGEAEKVYWEKINADRMARYNAKREKKRGSDKVARKADALQMQRQIHIRFDEEET